jgi:hypothetical protein
LLANIGRFFKKSPGDNDHSLPNQTDWKKWLEKFRKHSLGLATPGSPQHHKHLKYLKYLETFLQGICLLALELFEGETYPRGLGFGIGSGDYCACSGAEILDGACVTDRWNAWIDMGIVMRGYMFGGGKHASHSWVGFFSCRLGEFSFPFSYLKGNSQHKGHRLKLWSSE